MIQVTLGGENSKGLCYFTSSNVSFADCSNKTCRRIYFLIRWVIIFRRYSYIAEILEGNQWLLIMVRKGISSFKNY
jgi:hypothetical protein